MKRSPFAETSFHYRGHLIVRNTSGLYAIAGPPDGTGKLAGEFPLITSRFAARLFVQHAIAARDAFRNGARPVLELVL